MTADQLIDLSHAFMLGYFAYFIWNTRDTIKTCMNTIKILKQEKDDLLIIALNMLMTSSADKEDYATASKCQKMIDIIKEREQ